VLRRTASAHSLKVPLSTETVEGGEKISYLDAVTGVTPVKGDLTELNEKSLSSGASIYIEDTSKNSNEEEFEILSYQIKDFLSQGISFLPVSSKNKKYLLVVMGETVLIQQDTYEYPCGFIATVAGKALTLPELIAKLGGAKELKTQPTSGVEKPPVPKSAKTKGSKAKKEISQLKKEEASKPQVKPAVKIVGRQPGSSRMQFYNLSEEDSQKALRCLPENYLWESKTGDLRLKPIAMKGIWTQGLDQFLTTVSKMSFEDTISLVQQEARIKERTLSEKPNFVELWKALKDRYQGVNLLASPKSKDEKSFRSEYDSLKNKIISAGLKPSILPNPKGSGIKKKVTSQKQSNPAKGKSLIDPSLLATLALLKELKGIF